MKSKMNCSKTSSSVIQNEESATILEPHHMRHCWLFHALFQNLYMQIQLTAIEQS